MAGLAARHAILDVIGRLLTNRCQVEKLLFYGYVFSRFGKLPIFGRFVPQIISPIHVAASSAPEDADGHSRTGLSPLTAIRNPRSPDSLHTPVPYHQRECIPHKDPDRVVPSSDVGVKPRQPGALELSGISLVSFWDQNTW